jgi:hypothetical protein
VTPGQEKGVGWHLILWHLQSLSTVDVISLVKCSSLSFTVGIDQDDRCQNAWQTVGSSPRRLPCLGAIVWP